MTSMRKANLALLVVRGTSSSSSVHVRLVLEVTMSTIGTRARPRGFLLINLLAGGGGTVASSTHSSGLLAVLAPSRMRAIGRMLYLDRFFVGFLA